MKLKRLSLLLKRGGYKIDFKFKEEEDAKLCFDYGHGGSDPGGSYKGRREADDVLL